MDIKTIKELADQIIGNGGAKFIIIDEKNITLSGENKAEKKINFSLEMSDELIQDISDPEEKKYSLFKRSFKEFWNYLNPLNEGEEIKGEVTLIRGFYSIKSQHHDGELYIMDNELVKKPGE